MRPTFEFRKKGVGTGARGVGREIMRWMDRWGGGVREAYMMAWTRFWRGTRRAGSGENELGLLLC